MSHTKPLSQWIETVSTAFPALSRPQAKALRNAPVQVTVIAW